MTPIEHGIITGIVLIAGYAWVKAAPTFTTGLFRTTATLLFLSLLVASWF